MVNYFHHIFIRKIILLLLICFSDFVKVFTFQHFVTQFIKIRNCWCWVTIVVVGYYIIFDLFEVLILYFNLRYYVVVYLCVFIHLGVELLLFLRSYLITLVLIYDTIWEHYILYYSWILYYASVLETLYVLIFSCCIVTLAFIIIYLAFVIDYCRNSMQTSVCADTIIDF